MQVARIASWLLVLLLGMLLNSPAQAHDTWVLPKSFRTSVGQPLQVNISSGHGLQPLSALRRRRLRQLRLLGPGPARRGTGWRRLGRINVLQFKPSHIGLHCLVASLPAQEIRIESETVDEYLAEIRAAPELLRAWQAQQAVGTPWVEFYAKDAVTYLQVGRGGATRTPAGISHKLQIVPLADAASLRPRQTLPVQVLLDGRPLPGLALRLFDRRGEAGVASTDAQGKAALRVRHRGVQLIAATHLRAPVSAGDPWRSNFVTLGLSVGRA